MDTIASFFPNWHWLNLLIIPGLLVAFTIHELGHSLVAYFLGDTSQVKQGKITANPLKHTSWFGVALFLLFGIGFPKPLRFNPEHFKHRYLDTFLVSIAGPVANFAVSLAVFMASAALVFILRLNGLLDNQQISSIFFFTRNDEFITSMSFSQGMQNAIVWIIIFTNRVWMANFILAMVSLIPLPPLDGFTALLSLMGVVKEKRINDLTHVPPTSNAEPQPESLVLNPPPAVNKKETIAGIHFRLGAEYHQQKKFSDAIARYRQAIKADPTFGPAYVNLGLAYKAKNQPNEATHALRGATQYATDEKSKAQAWAELHNLSSLPEASLEHKLATENPGTVPWVDIKPSPNWLSFWAGLIALLLIFSCTIGALLTNLIRGSF